MNYCLSTDNIKFVKYGILHKMVDVTEKVKTILDNDYKLIIDEVFSSCNNYYKKMSVLSVYLKDGNTINALHGSTLYTNMVTDSEIVNNNINNNFSKVPQINNYIVSTNARDENNIIEWILYHLLLGFDKIVIIDHKSIIPISQLIQHYEWRKRVHIIRREDEGPVKMKFLNEIIIPYMMNNCKKYFIHLDADEYIYINTNYIGTFLSKYNTDILVMHWLMFGNNNNTINNHPYKCLIPTFTKSDEKLHSHFKCFIKIRKNAPFTFTSPHTIKYNVKIDTIYTNVMNNKCSRKNLDGINFNELVNELYIDSDINIVPGYINHYYIQGSDDYINRKVNRLRDDISAAREYDENILKMYNNINNNNIINYSKNIINMIEDIKTFGFIIIRYVNSPQTNQLWINCYNSIRRFYNNMIIIIDDNSNPEFLTEYNTINTKIIKSEFPRRGEFLPYYYFIKNKFFFRAIVLHDSMILNKYYDFNNINIKYKNYTRLFSFPSSSYNTDIEHFKEMCSFVKNGQQIYKYHTINLKSLIGCFGVCYVIDYDFLITIQKKYNIINLINYIDTRRKRMCLERFLSCLFEYYRGKSFITSKDLFGNILSNNNEYITKHFFGR